MQLQVDGRLLVGGEFTTILGQSRTRLARLSTAQAAVQSLELTDHGSTLTWHRSGPAPEVIAAPVVAYSVDGNDFTTLGPMTRVAGSWQRSGMPAPMRQTYFLRVQGIVSGSGHSEGRIESLRQFHNEDGLLTDGFD